MIFFRKMLFPFAVLYGWITQFRNFLFDQGILKSYHFNLPIIAVGNLSVGGTGKTPQIEYLIRFLQANRVVWGSGWPLQKILSSAMAHISL